MDIGAFCKIEDLSSLMKANGISVPRLRGLRLMSNESLINPSKDLPDDVICIYCITDLCESIPFWTSNSSMSHISCKTRDKFHHLVEHVGPDDTPHIRWDRIRGKKRRVLKTMFHNLKRKIEKQYEVFNKYVGREDVLYIHARIGGNNWPMYYKDVQYQPWFLEKVDDWFDSTYCDIYAKIGKEEEDEGL